MAGRVNELQVNWFFQDDKGLQPYWLSVDNFFQAIIDSFHPSKISMYRYIRQRSFISLFKNLIIFHIIFHIIICKGMHSLCWLQS
jgi:hypothetical protein